MKTLAIIPAGGVGRRMGGGVPKQYLPLAGIPVLARTLRPFQDSPDIDEIYLAVPEGDIPEVRQRIVEPYGLSKVGLILAGGRERQDSVRNALDQLRVEQEIIVVHDAVRPFVTAALIEQSVAAARKYGAVSLGVPVKDTVKEVNPAGWVEKTLDRQRLWLTQTPQAFHRSILLAAYEKAARDGISATDDAGLVEAMGTAVRMIPGAEANIKLTTAEDMVLGEVILGRRT
ncbi:MAG: 2-C-methyl-D-erythritol 4-phosphate cytidylyltransferase [Deltaproteobacteria bacterium]|nr:2-C-methyl-D-erythritol 4-phosphate cytidylyltransferase [Deltaproteobacteria bacterium]